MTQCACCARQGRGRNPLGRCAQLSGQQRDGGESESAATATSMKEGESILPHRLTTQSERVLIRNDCGGIYPPPSSDVGSAVHSWMASCAPFVNTVVQLGILRHEFGSLENIF